MKDMMINPFAKFDKDWALVTAGNIDDFNTMTVSWGSMGTIWNKSVVTIYVRPDRYTSNYLKDNDYFTVSFYDDKYKDKLLVFGRTSGKETNKVKETGFTPVCLDKAITYKEAKETFVLKKVYMEQMKKELCPKEALAIYKDGIEPHYLIIGEVVDIK